MPSISSVLGLPMFNGISSPLSYNYIVNRYLGDLLNKICINQTKVSILLNENKLRNNARRKFQTFYMQKPITKKQIFRKLFIFETTLPTYLLTRRKTMTLIVGYLLLGTLNQTLKKIYLRRLLNYTCLLASNSIFLLCVKMASTGFGFFPIQN